MPGQNRMWLFLGSIFRSWLTVIEFPYMEILYLITMIEFVRQYVIIYIYISYIF